METSDIVLGFDCRRGREPHKENLHTVHTNDEEDVYSGGSTPLT